MTRYDINGPRQGGLEDQLYFTAPAGGVVAGSAYLIGSLLVVAEESALAGTVFSCWCTGTYRLAKATGIAWTEGMLLYFDPAAKNLTNVTTNNVRVGVAATAAASGDTIGWARIGGAAAPTGA